MAKKEERCLMQVGDKVRVRDSGKIGFVRITNRFGGMYPIGVILREKRKGWDFLNEAHWVAACEKGRAWIGNESELQIIPRGVVLELLYKSFFAKSDMIEKCNGYYEKAV